VAIDFENTQAFMDDFQSSKRGQAGLAILDSKTLGQSSLQRAISAYQFVTGPQSYVRNATAKFLFGLSVPVKTARIRNAVVAAMPVNRKVIIIGHGADVDVNILKRLDIHNINVIAIIDTCRIASEIFPETLSPANLLWVLGRRFRPGSLQGARNDARFTLEAALGLALRGLEPKQGLLVDDGEVSAPRSGTVRRPKQPSLTTSGPCSQYRRLARKFSKKSKRDETEE
jgi:hypothetical protein